jgi:hypothetical protein
VFVSLTPAGEAARLSQWYATRSPTFLFSPSYQALLVLDLPRSIALGLSREDGFAEIQHFAACDLVFPLYFRHLIRSGRGPRRDLLVATTLIALSR